MNYLLCAFSNFICSYKHVSMDFKQTEMCFISIDSDSDYLLMRPLFWNWRTIFFVFAGMVWPVSTTMCALSVTGEFYLSIYFLNQHLDLSPDWNVCFPGKVKASAGGTNPTAAVWFLPSGEKMAWLTSPSSVSETLMEYLRVSSTSGRNAPENSLFSATINAGSFLCEFPSSRSSVSEESRGTDLDLSSSPALLHLPPCSYSGEARLPLHAEQVWHGVRRGCSLWCVRGWKLQREYCASC